MPQPTVAAAPTKTEDTGKKKERSPGYPGISLQTAIARTKILHDAEKQTPTSVSVAASDWGMKPTSSSTMITISALKGYGLVSDTGVGDKRKLQVTDAARRIILDERPDSTERIALIKAAALSPKLHRILWNKWGSDLPSDANMNHSLIFDHKFNANTVGEFIRLYKDTIRFAKLNESDKVSPEVAEGEDESGHVYSPKVGDYVQWESNGVHQFAEPKRLREISGDGNFAFVDGSYTGMPVADLRRAQAPTGGRSALPFTGAPASNSPSSKILMQEFVVPLSDGTRAVFQWPTSLTKDDIDDLKDSLKILERKISRSMSGESAKEQVDES